MENKIIEIKVKDFNKYLEQSGQGTMEDYEDEYDLLDMVKEYLVEKCEFFWGGGVNTIGDNTDFELKGNKIVVDVEYFDDSQNPDFVEQEV